MVCHCGLRPALHRDRRVGQLHPAAGQCVEQALDRAVANGVKNLVVQPTHLMHGAEYDDLIDAVEAYSDKFDSVEVAEPLLGEVGEDATVINADKEAVAKAVVAEAVDLSDYDTLDAAAEDGVAIVFMGTYKLSQLSYITQTVGDKLREPHYGVSTLNSLY